MVSPSAPHLPRLTCRLDFRIQRDAGFSSYTGSLWRGQFGAQLRRMACLTGAERCNGCKVRSRCPYDYLFETTPPEGTQLMGNYPHVPHPLVLSPPPDFKTRRYAASSRFPLTVHLFGRAGGYLDLVLHVLSRVGEEGLGRDRVTMRIDSVLPEGSRSITYRPGVSVGLVPVEVPPPPPPTGPISIVLQTPLRLVADGHLMSVEKFSFRAFFANLLRRISMLTALHTDRALNTDFAALVRLAAGIPVIACTLRWQEWRRYSSRQQRTIPMGGLLGHFTVDLRKAEALWPYLWLGQWTHAGKGTIMGLGRYRIHSCPPSS